MTVWWYKLIFSHTFTDLSVEGWDDGMVVRVDLLEARLESRQLLHHLLLLVDHNSVIC